jgi:EAL domain-containing protein (putative c-di-GMP-specific phosphodiesterase class I)
MTHAPPPASSLERYLAFAFAGADLLVEVDQADRIVFAEGAFQARFGEGAAQFTGAPVARLVAPDQQGQLAGAMAMLRSRGRLSPTPMRLSDRARTPAMLAGLARPGRGAALTFGPMPEAFIRDAPGQRPGDMLRALEARLRARSGGALTMVEVSAAAADPAALANAVQGALAGIAPGALPDQLEAGRFGVLTDAPPPGDLARALVQEALAAQGIAADSVAVSGIALDPAGLTPPQAVRAIRFALGRFAAQGQGGLDQLGDWRTLSGLIGGATQRAASLRGAIQARRFSLMFQPIVGLADRKLHHHEALIRPDAAEAASPAEFVAMAEAVGLTEELDLAVAAAAADALANAPHASAAVNISGHSLESPKFLERLAQICRARGNLRERLMFELTETAEIGRPDIVEAALALLREAGPQVSLDDFGAGQAGFGYLQRFAVDFVKIDGHYVRNALAAPRERTILASITDLAHALNSRVIAEQVETEAQAQMLMEMKVEFAQGWLFGRPGKSFARD